MQGFAWFVLFMAAIGAAAVWMMAADLRVRHKALTELLDQKERDLLYRYREVEAMMEGCPMPSAPASAGAASFESYLESVPRIQSNQTAAPPLSAADHRRSAAEDLLRKGFEPEDIARDLSMGKGEVRLIASLLKKTAG